MVLNTVQKYKESSRRANKRPGKKGMARAGAGMAQRRHPHSDTAAAKRLPGNVDNHVDNPVDNAVECSRSYQHYARADMADMDINALIKDI